MRTVERTVDLFRVSARPDSCTEAHLRHSCSIRKSVPKQKPKSNFDPRVLDASVRGDRPSRSTSYTRGNLYDPSRKYFVG